MFVCALNFRFKYSVLQDNQIKRSKINYKLEKLFLEFNNLNLVSQSLKILKV